MNTPAHLIYVKKNWNQLLVEPTAAEKVKGHFIDTVGYKEEVEVVWIRTAPVGSLIWILSHQGAELWKN